MLKIKKKFGELEVGSRFTIAEGGPELVKLGEYSAAVDEGLVLASYALDMKTYWLPNDKDVLHAVTNHPQVKDAVGPVYINRVVSGDLMHLREGILSGDNITVDTVVVPEVSFAGNCMKYQTRPPKQYVKWGDTGIDVPKPMDEHPNNGAVYYWVNFYETNVNKHHWDNDGHDVKIFKRFGCYDNKEDAKKCYEAVKHLFNRNGKGVSK